MSFSFLLVMTLITVVGLVDGNDVGVGTGIIGSETVGITVGGITGVGITGGGCDVI